MLSIVFNDILVILIKNKIYFKKLFKIVYNKQFIIK